MPTQNGWLFRAVWSRATSFQQFVAEREDFIGITTKLTGRCEALAEQRSGEATG